MRFVSGLVVLLGLLALLGYVHALPTISTSVSSNMLFQRNAANCIWGKFANKTINVTLINNNTAVAPANRVFTFSNKTNADGSFELWIPASVYTYYGYNNFTVRIADGAPGVITLTNVIYGELWLCAGQSNMDFAVSHTFDYQSVLNNETRFSNLRLYRTPNVNNTAPQDYVTTSGWYPATSTSLFPYFQAVCYAFGRELIKKTGIPVGLIGTSWGGTYIEAWSSPAALAQCPRPGGANFTGTGNNAASVLYNGKLYPYRRFAVNGFLWYQGEANNGRPQLYSCQLPALIRDMRSLFRGNKQAPFGFVQLTAWNLSTIAEPYYYQMRYAMVNGTQNTPRVYYTTGIDLGDLQSPYGTIHSRNKTLLGQRLYNTIGYDYYNNKTSIPPFGPTFKSCCSTYNSATNTLTYEVTFNGTANLVQIATPFCNACCSISPFDVLAKNAAGGLVRVAVNNTRYSGNKAIFTLYRNAIPVGYNVTQVRYAAYDYPQCLVYNPVNVQLLIAPQFNVTCPTSCPTTTTTTSGTATPKPTTTTTTTAKPTTTTGAATPKPTTTTTTASATPKPTTTTGTATPKPTTTTTGTATPKPATTTTTAKSTTATTTSATPKPARTVDSTAGEV